jgi:hypothetical protein
MLVATQAMADWWDEISSYLNDAAADYPHEHPDRRLYTQARSRLQNCYNGLMGFERILRERPPVAVVYQIDHEYTASGVEHVMPLPPIPNAHQRVWAKENYLFVKTTPPLTETDYLYLYNAMMQDTSSGTKTGNLRHWSTKVRGNINGMIWYTHQYSGNRLLAIGECNPTARSITVLRIGRVNDGFHCF